MTVRGGTDPWKLGTFQRCRTGQVCHRVFFSRLRGPFLRVNLDTALDPAWHV